MFFGICPDKCRLRALIIFPACHLFNWLGVMIQSNTGQAADIAPIKSDLAAASYLGRRVAETVRELQPV